MEIIACRCGDLPDHTHVYELKQDGETIKYVEDPYDVVIWVDWKAVARATA